MIINLMLTSRVKDNISLSKVFLSARVLGACASVPITPRHINGSVSLV